MTKKISIMIVLISAGCSVQPRAMLKIPPPKENLPLPYKGVNIQAITPKEKNYANYLLSTPLFPDEANCGNELFNRLKDQAMEGSIISEWVTKPYLAWGGIWKVGAVVGPVEHLYSIIESHVTWLDHNGKEQLATYSCFVQYALQSEAPAWQAGHLKYGANLETGHKKYVSFPAQIYITAPPGTATEWEQNVRFYRED